MSSKYAEKIRQRKEKLKKNKLPTILRQTNKIWFWLFFFALVSVIGFLSYQAYSGSLTNELIIPIAIVIIPLFALIIWYLPKFYVQSLPNEAGKAFDRENAKLKLEDDTRKTFAQIVGGVFLLGGLIFTYNTYRIQVEQVKIQTKQQEIAQEGQITDRFTKAITQLGDEKLEVRLGGLYALERIAGDSPKDHWNVMEIISAYVREKAKKKPTEYNDNKNNTNNKLNETKQNRRVPTDIQAALTIIGRRKIEQDPKTDKITDKIDLSQTDLRNAELNGANLRRLYLINADLRGAYLGDADLNEAGLWGTDLRKANLREANLTKAFLEVANLREASLDKAVLFGADLTKADLRKAYLGGADLREANLGEADLSEASLFDADLRQTILSGAKNLTFEQLSGAIINESTELPDYLESRKAELLEISIENLKEKERILKERNKK